MKICHFAAMLAVLLSLAVIGETIPAYEVRRELVQVRFVNSFFACVDIEYLVKFKGITLKAGALVYWLWEEAHVPKVVGSNPSTIYWMDIFSHLFVVKIVMFV